MCMFIVIPRFKGGGRGWLVAGGWWLVAGPADFFFLSHTIINFSSKINKF